TAAAIAAGLVSLGLGTGSGGAIRIPAACCGVTGVKPTDGLVPTGGGFPLAPGFDHPGPMGRDRRGCLGRGGAPAPGCPLSWVEHAEPLVRGRVEAAAATFARSRPLSFPEPVGTTPLFMHEVAGVHRELIEEHGELYGDNPRTKIERCLAVTDADAAAASDAR